MLVCLLLCTGRGWGRPACDSLSVVASATDHSVVWVSTAEELAALGTLKDGTEVVWRDGSYVDQQLTLRGEGSAERPILFRAETPGQVHFRGNSRIVIRGAHLVVSGFWWQDPTPEQSKSVVTFHRESHHATLTQCAITGTGLTADAKTDTKWISLRGTANRVERCSFLNKRNKGALLVVWFDEGLTPRHQILNNHFERPLTLFNEQGKPMNGQETIRIGDSNSSMRDGEVVVEGNRFYECHGEQAEIISNKSCANTYRGNLFEKSHGTLTLRHGNNCHVVGNFFLGGGVEGSGGVRIIGEGHLVEQNYMEGLRGRGYKAAICLVRGERNPELSGYWQVKGAVVRGNIMVDCNCALQVNYGTESQIMPVVDSKIERNIVSLSDQKYYAVRCVEQPRPRVEWSGNLIYGGRVEGVTLEQISTAPRTPKVERVVEQIRLRSGVSW